MKQVVCCVEWVSQFEYRIGPGYVGLALASSSEDFNSFSMKSAIALSLDMFRAFYIQ
jgi:hypothetical protein